MGRSSSAGVVTTYTDVSAFTGSLEEFWSNGFVGITSSGTLPNPSSFSGTSTSGTSMVTYSHSATASGGLYGWAPGIPGPAITPFYENTDLVFNGFSPGISAFGGRFWVADFNDGFLIPGQTVTLTLSLSNNTTAVASTIVSSTASFLGMTVDPSVTISGAVLSRPGSVGRSIVSGQVVGGTVVPEPATLPLVWLAGGGLFAAWRLAGRRHAARSVG